MKKNLVAIALVTGCAAEDAGVDLALVPDPNLSTPSAIVQLVDSLTFVIDSDEGLYDASDLTSEGDVRVVDADDDPALELVATVPVGEALPVVRIERGGLGDRAFDVRITGTYADPGRPDRATASGTVRGLSVEEGVERITVPFNLKPSELPPRVADVIPSEGDRVDGCSVPLIVVTFTRPMDPQSLFAPGAFVIDPGGEPAEVRVDESGRVAQLVPENIPRIDANSIGYRLTVSSVARDLRGVPLDQVPSIEGDQPFEREAIFFCGAMTSDPFVACGQEQPPGGPMLPARCAYPQLSCVDGECVLTGCGNVRCVDGYVCEPASSRCEVDCRLYQEGLGCESGTCDPETGLCL